MGKHENELRLSGDLFYTWQYEIRWAATELRKKGTLKSSEESKRENLQKKVNEAFGSWLRKT